MNVEIVEDGGEGGRCLRAPSGGVLSGLGTGMRDQQTDEGDG